MRAISEYFCPVYSHGNMCESKLVKIREKLYQCEKCGIRISEKSLSEDLTLKELLYEISQLNSKV